MAKVGEVEFLVKFDTVGKEFKDVLRDSLKDMDFGGVDIEQKLATIQSHLGLLVTPFSGNRLTDLIKSQGYLEMLRNPDWIEKKVEAIASSQTLLTKLGIGAVPGSQEAKKEAEESFGFLTKDIANFMKVTFSSEFAFAKNFPTLQDVIGLLTTATEGNLPYLMEKIIDKLRVETNVDEGIFGWLEDMGVKTSGQRLWDITMQDIKAENEENVISSYQEFLDLIGDKFKDEEDIVRILFGSTRVYEKPLKKKLEEILESTTFKEGLGLPRGLINTINEIKGTKIEISRSFKNDLKFIVQDAEKAKEIIEKMSANLKDEDRTNLIERAMKAIEQFGWYFLYGESKITGAPRKLAEDLERLPPSMRNEFLSAASAGKGFSVFQGIASSNIPVEQRLEELRRTSPAEIWKITKNTLEELGGMSDFLKGMEKGLPSIIADETAKRILDATQQIKTIFGE